MGSGNGKGKDLTRLSHPRGIWVDGGNHRLICWEEETRHETVIVGGCEKDANTNQLAGREGLSFDFHGHLFVADWINHRLQCFSHIRS